MKTVAVIHNDFPTKFGLPRQSGLIEGIESAVVFEPEFRVKEALRGIEGFDYLWLIWEFHMAQRDTWSPTIRPPILGGNVRMGVFATRSPFRPNPIGLSCVKLERIGHSAEWGDYLVVSGTDMMDGTPILDIKPYLPYADSHPEAKSGFTAEHHKRTLQVEIPVPIRMELGEEKAALLEDILAQDPRPAYKEDSDHTYVMPWGKWEVCFQAIDGTAHVR